MSSPPSWSSVTPDALSSSYDSSIIVRRWGATWLDFVVVGSGALVALSLPAELQSAALVAILLLALSYYPACEHLFGRTAGKLICRVRVLDGAGRFPSWSQVLGRTLLRLVEVNPILLGGLPAGIAVLSSKKRQRLGDMVADTYVIREEDYRLMVLARTNPAALPASLPPPVRRAPSSSLLVPTNLSGWAIAAGYLGLFAVLALPAPFALGAGILALRQIAQTPGLGGKGRAIFGVVMGALFSLLLVFFLVVSLFGE